MASFLVDTDIFIDHLRAIERIPVPTQDSAYSVISRAELYAGRSADEGSVDSLLDLFGEIEIGRTVAEEAGRIRRSSQLAIPDAIIAATAIREGLVLVTRNIRHFARVDGLKLR